MQEMKISKAFLSIDIAFALIIMSFAFILLLIIQNDISQEMQREDISDIQNTNQYLFDMIKVDRGRNHMLSTNKQIQYQLKLYETQGKIKLYYFE
ncbi:hypothetical protein CQA53_00090 [Helicobacter didelphidarum]|uniref:Uncharacterized protein n=1 Tax=Helicobacter didelphidarum TaxID=2040648 RepID=A0A3D8IQA9_9HELI|nr:hypothetical protein [Helicobacter didelphidarum]RDU67468.1 hypothetical protein CQA53_00090 [Helicobacter didelphidarum]